MRGRLNAFQNLICARAEVRESPFGNPSLDCERGPVRTAILPNLVFPRRFSNAGSPAAFPEPPRNEGEKWTAKNDADIFGRPSLAGFGRFEKRALFWLEPAAPPRCGRCVLSRPTIWECGGWTQLSLSPASGANVPSATTAIQSGVEPPHSTGFSAPLASLRLIGVGPLVAAPPRCALCASAVSLAVPFGCGRAAL